MAKVTMKNAAGKAAASVELPDAMFGIVPNISVMHQVVIAQLAHRRAGTQSTKGRAQVRGGGRKPFAQKEPVMPVRVRFARRTSLVVVSPLVQRLANTASARQRKWCN